MALPFKVTFKQGYRVVPVLDFSENDAVDRLPETVLYENVPLTVLFESDDDQARFYMDGLDALPVRQIREDNETGEAYLAPSPHPVILYENTEAFYPFIPGHYRIEVVVRGRTYYSWMTIAPKQVDRAAWQAMRDEIEAVLTGLARDFGRQATVGVPLGEEGLSPQAVRMLMTVKQRYASIMAAIHDIYRAPRGKIKKIYTRVPAGRFAVYDEATIRHRLRHPEEMRRLKVPQREIDYDLIENKMLKRLIRAWMAVLADHPGQGKRNGTEPDDWPGAREGATDDPARGVDEQEWADRLLKMKKALQRLYNAPWMKKVDATKPVSASPHALSDSRYQVMVRLYEEWFKPAAPREAAGPWKRTDKLYEIWGVIKLIRCLSEGPLGFRPVEGWLFDGKEDSGAIQDLPEGTRIVFEKGAARIHLVYDEKLPRTSGPTDPDRLPLFMTHGHNRPDARLDFYVEAVYIGSLLVDFKYRPRAYIWQPEQLETGVRPKVMAQLIDYGNACRSRFLFGAPDHPFFFGINPVLEVWGLYPDEQRSGEVIHDPDYRLRLMDMTPGRSDVHVVQVLEAYWQRLFKRYEWARAAWSQEFFESVRTDGDQ